jgi:hypothetical protein
MMKAPLGLEVMGWGKRGLAAAGSGEPQPQPPHPLLQQLLLTLWLKAWGVEGLTVLTTPLEQQFLALLLRSQLLLFFLLLLLLLVCRHCLLR